MDVGDFRELVVRPALQFLAKAAKKPRLWSPAAENLVLGTGIHESGGLRYLWQRKANDVRLDHEQAGRGLFQIQPGTHEDLWFNYLRHRPALADALNSLSMVRGSADLKLIGNLSYAAAVCRLIYWRRPEPLPEADDIEGMARYWGLHYQTESDPEKIARWITDYNRYVKDR